MQTKFSFQKFVHFIQSVILVEYHETHQDVWINEVNGVSLEHFGFVREVDHPNSLLSQQKQIDEWQRCGKIIN